MGCCSRVRPVGDTGRLYLQVLRRSDDRDEKRRAGRGSDREDDRRAGLSPMDVDALVAEIEELGGRVLSRDDVVEPGTGGPHGTDPAEQSREVSRLVVTWQR